MLCSHRLCLLSLVCMIGSLTAAGAPAADGGWTQQQQQQQLELDLPRALLFEQAVPIMDAFPGAGTPGAYGGGMPAIAQPEEAPMGDYEPLAPEPQPVPVQDDGTTVLPAVSEANRRVELSGSASATSEAEASAGPRLASASVATPQVAWWSGGQVAGLVLGVAAASGVAAAVIVGLRRRRPAASSRYSAGCGHEVEMLGLI